MPKGYISFSDFKANQKAKPRIQKCPKCHKPTDTIVYNNFGRGMCIDCYTIEQEKFAARRKRNDTEKDLGLELDIEYDRY